MTISEYDTIQTTTYPDCYVCGTRGVPLYQGLRDRLFGVPGEWGMKKCPNPGCGLVWLDPMPLPEDIGKAYRSYYTHQDSNSAGGLTRRFYQRVKTGYVAGRYGYSINGHSALGRMLGWLIYLQPGLRADCDSNVFYLRAQPGGRLLEVGCGSGVMLKRMQDLGWQVEGVDFDPSAVCNAQEKGLTVHLGDLADQKYPNDTFDAIVMSHLIEHIPDPLALLQQCYRVMKPGGRLVVITPNVASWGHRLFGSDWRGLEPPRHLFLYSPDSLYKLAIKSRLKIKGIRTTSHGAVSIYVETNMLQSNLPASSTPSLSLRMLAHLYQFREGVVNLWKKSYGNELLLEAQKPL